MSRIKDIVENLILEMRDSGEISEKDKKEITALLSKRVKEHKENKMFDTVKNITKPSDSKLRLKGMCSKEHKDNVKQMENNLVYAGINLQ